MKPPSASRTTQRMFSPPDPDEVSGGDGVDGAWLVTWADAITVLLGFFVLLFSLSQVDTERFEAVREALSGDRVVPQPLPSDDTQTRTGPELANRLEELLSAATFAGAVRVERLPAGVVIELPAGALFAEGATLDPEVVDSLATVAWEIRQPDMRDYMVEVQALDGWEQSGDRALTVARFLNTQGVPTERLRATAFGDLGPHLRRSRGGSMTAPEAPTIRLLLERP